MEPGWLVCHGNGAMKITYYGHSCLGLESGGKHLLFDPFVTPNELAASIDVESIPADLILVSHGHLDHIADAVTIAKRTGAIVVSNYEVSQWLGAQGVDNTQPMNHGGGFESMVGRIEFVNAVHSSVLPDGTYGGNPGGFVLELREGGFYFAGDTALTWDMKLLEGRCGLAALPIGDHFTMGARDAVRAARFVGVRDIIGIHYDTFPPIRIDHEQARAIFDEAGLKLHLPAIGETIEL